MLFQDLAQHVVSFVTQVYSGKSAEGSKNFYGYYPFSFFVNIQLLESYVTPRRLPFFLTCKPRDFIMQQTMPHSHTADILPFTILLLIF